jgi:hypothetical protein
MDAIREIDGLLESDDPSGWAYENLDLVGEGHHAMVYRHPLRDDMVIRVAPFPEGFFGHAAEADDPCASPHAPLCHAVALVEDTLVGACERLEPVRDDDREAAGWIAVARQVVLGRADSVDPSALAAFRLAQPGFEEFARSLGPEASDLRDENWLLRGRTLVLNDPVPMMPPEAARRVEAAALGMTEMAVSP